MITIINNNLGNIRSIYNMLKYLNIKVNISDNIKELEVATKIILPGIGSFDSGMEKLENFIEVLNYKILEEKVPVLGICLGMQLLCKCSEEGIKKGLSWVNIEVKKFNTLRVPHVGWNFIKTEHQIFKNIEKPKFYFVHTYYVPLSRYTIAETEYNVKFSSAIQKENIIGVQFHPEKSHKFGMKFFQNFNEL